MKINTLKAENNNNNKKTSFKSMNLSPLSKALYTLNNNDMLNASFVDVFAMDTPRTIVEFNNRGKNAGIEMGFREYTGTFIAEFSAILFALLTSKAFSNKYKPQIGVNSSSWITDKGLETFKNIYNNAPKTPEGFVDGVLQSMSGLAGKEHRTLGSVAKEKLKPVSEELTGLITNKGMDKAASKQVLENVQTGIVNLLGADNNITLSSGGKEFTANLSHVIRDTVDAGKNIFFKDGVNSNEVVDKLKKLNKSRIAFAIPASMLLAVTNQYINRQITKKRTGIDNFVGENGYENNVKNKNNTGKEKGLLAKKAASAGVFLAMLTKVMGIKKPSDIVSKLEFNGPATGGNAIKTIYGTLILGRIFASKDSTELRETTVRDYLGFLNWLVLGGFVAKGVGQMFDPKQQNLFNIAKEGSGIKHWLSDVSLKSQKEIFAQGGNIKKNLRNLNIAQMSGIAYSALMLGVLLPKLNIWMTKHNGGKKEAKENLQRQTFGSEITSVSLEEFQKTLSSRKSYNA